MTLTIAEIEAELKAEGMPASWRTVMRKLKRHRIRPLTRNTIPHRYPRSEVDRLRKIGYGLPPKAASPAEPKLITVREAIKRAGGAR